MVGTAQHVGPEETVTDKVVLTLPAGSGFHSVGTLVLGGIGSRIDLPYERMDDLQLALVSALGEALGDQVTMEVDAAPGELRVALGPVRDGSREDAGLALVLSRLVDSVEHEQRGERAWVSLVVRAAQPAPSD